MALRKIVATSDDPAGVICGIDNDDVTRESSDGAVNGDLGAVTEKAAGYFEEVVGIHAKRPEAYSRVIKETTEDFTSTGQTDASPFFSTQQELVQTGSHLQATT